MTSGVTGCTKTRRVVERGCHARYRQGHFSSPRIHRLSRRRIFVTGGSYDPAMKAMSVELHGIGGSIDELSSSEVDLISDDDLESTLVELSRFQERLQAGWCRRFREFDRRRLWRRGAFTSAASWVQDRCHMAWGAARERLEVARALEEGMPRTKEAFSSEELSYAGCDTWPKAPSPTPKPS
jgi:hypothetical protein